MSEELNNPLAGMFAMVDAEAGHEFAEREDGVEQIDEVTDETKTDAPADAADKTDDESNAEKVDNKGEASDTQAEQVILSKDGKHTIPFNVLEGERAKREAAESMAQQLQQQLAALQASQNANPTDSNSQDNAETALLDEETLKEVEEVFPGLAKGLRAQNEQLKALSDQVLQERALHQQQSENVAINNAQAALNANEKLVFIRDNRPDLWAEAMKLDDTLKQLPEYEGATYEKRFEDVARFIELKYGEVMTPSQESKEVQEVAPKEDAPKPVVKKQTTPNSLSDMPSGNLPTERVTLNTADASQARQMFKGMTSDQIMAQINAS